jgi:type IV pilus assembly protein PilB
MNLVVSQRLLRKICVNCAEETQVSPDYLLRVGINPDDFKDVTLYKGAGCSVCNNTGYKGRLGIFEAMTLTPQIRELILDRASTDKIQREAEKEMETLRDIAVTKLKRGITTVDEVLKETTIK